MNAAFHRLPPSAIGSLSQGPACVARPSSMLAFAQKYPEWRDFPRGLRVLVVDEDEHLLADLKSKLEAFDYVVTTFASSGDAVVALQSQSGSFHVALVEATTGENVDGWRVLEAATYMPVIMMSSTENMAVMMKGLASGASEFLQKPLPDKALKNIWQHVVRKAICNGEVPLPEFLQAEEDSETPSILLRLETADQVKMGTLETRCRTDSSTDDRRAADSLVEVKIEPSTDEVEPADLFIHEDGNSTLFDIKPALAEDCGFLSSERFERFASTATSWGVSAEPCGSHGFVSVKNALNASSPEFPVYEGYLQAKADFEDMSDESSADLCGLLGADMEDDLAEVDDLETTKSDHCSDLQFDEELELEDSLGDTTVSSQFVVDGDTLSSVEMDPNSLDGLTFSQGLALGSDSLDGAMGLDTDFADEEALLLEEVKRADEKLARNSSETSRQRRLSGSSETSSTDNKEAKQGDLEEPGDGSKISQGKRKRKVDWTPELHRRFVQAVEQLGVDKAIPSRILEIMGVQCLTRHNIASHLQKYRSHRKHLLVREAEAASWNQRRHLETTPWGRPRRDGPSWLSHTHHAAPPIQPRPPAVPLAPMQPQGHAVVPPLHVWGHPTVDQSHMHMWQKPPVAATAWRTSSGTLWQQPACIDAWGHPAPAPGMPFYPQAIMRLPLAPMPGVANMAYPVLVESATENADVTNSIFGNGRIPTFHLSKETVDAAINEVLTNPCTPLPLGLKPPSLESVINELQRQVIRTASVVSS